MSEVAHEGIEVGEVVDNRGTPYIARLVWELGEPTIRFLGEGAPRYSYYLSSLLSFAGHPEFLYFDRGQEVCVAWPQVESALMQALKCIPGSVGRFEVKWIESDPRVPF